MTPTTRSRVLVGSALVIAAVVPAVLVVAFGDRLPDRAYGPPGGFGSLSWTSVALLPALGTVLGAALLAVLYAYLLDGRRPSHGDRRMAALLSWFLAAVVLNRVGAAIARNVDRTGPPTAPDPWWASGPAVAFGAMAAGLLALRAIGRAPAPEPAGSGPGPRADRLPLGPAERATWTQSVFSRRGLADPAVAALPLVITVLLLLPTEPLAMVLVGLQAVGVLALLARCWVRVRVDQAGVTVRQPLLRHRLTGADLRHVVEAGTRILGPHDVVAGSYGPFEHGSLFGYRAAREAEALSLRLTDGREFVVTAAGAATAAALVNTLLDRREEGRRADPDRPDIDRAAG